MECPVCDQINTDGVSTCFSCGQPLPLYMGGVSVDTAHAQDGNRMVVAGNIDFPLPPIKTPARPQPPSSQLPKPSSLLRKTEKSSSSRLPKPPSLPKVKIEPAATPEEETPLQVAAVDTDAIAVKPLFPPVASSSFDEPPLIAPMGRPSHMIYAGFWYRFLAWLIDIAILGVAQGLLGLVVMMTSAGFVFRSPHFSGSLLSFFSGAYGAVALACIALSLLYFALSESSRWQGTIGKRAIGVKVTDAGGNRISFFRSLTRYVAHIVSNLTFGIGYLLNVFTSRQQTLHDLIAGTLVVYKEVTPLDLADNPEVPTQPAQKMSVLLVWVMSAMLVITAIVVVRSLVEAPTYKTTSVAARMHEAEMLGAQATAAVSDYQESHGQFPLSLEEIGFHQTSPQVRQIWINAESSAIHLELAFSPLRKKTLIFTPEFDEDGDLVWRCHSSDIDPKHLPEHCR